MTKNFSHQKSNFGRHNVIIGMIADKLGYEPAKLLSCLSTINLYICDGLIEYILILILFIFI